VGHQGQEEPESPEYTKAEVRAEIRKEMLFLLPPMVLGALFVLLYFRVDALRTLWDGLTRYHWVTGFFGSLLGLLVGGFVVWLTRILGTLGFGREAMGMGDVHLMAGVGAVVGAGASTVAFFLAPFFGIILALYLLFTGKRRELPYGPYLSLATAFVLLFYCPIAAWLAPGAEGLRIIVGQLFGVPA
jgi:leader peptidase (prepilin peptidase)/N-methyltransferase